MKIYECLLERDYEGVSQTFCTINKEEAFDWLDNNHDDHATIKVWEHGEELESFHYGFNNKLGIWVKEIESIEEIKNGCYEFGRYKLKEQLRVNNEEGIYEYVKYNSAVPITEEEAKDIYISCYLTEDNLIEEF